jgi:predicted outer membrane protein
MDVVMSSRPTAVLLAAAAVVLAVACSRAEPPSKLTADSAAGVATTASENDADRPDPEATAAQALLQTLADRDEAVLETARLALTRREQLKVSADARRVLSEQRRESNRLLGMLKGELHVSYKPEISSADQSLLDSLNGAGVGDFDRIFLGVIAKHYEDDAQLIERALPTIAQKLRETLTEIQTQRTNDAAAFRKQLAAMASVR